ncbi:RNA polymerase sigma factor RpoD/SigA [Ignavibacterium sp.]|uniref:sigma-70 family RNA polymerase sigma factor n=1 Tax=Ignavibacterium sp. TaxID=2651167 RepID=UPI00307CD483
MKLFKHITNREAASLDKYLSEIAKEPLLTPEDEIRLAIQIRNGDNPALERLIKSNLRFVVSVAKQYQNQGLSLGDLINEGNVGLMKAARRFDETRGFKFISYAVWWIRQSILQALAEQSRIVRLPLNRVGTLNRIGKEYGRLEQEFEREPSPEELASALEMDVDELSDVLRMNGKPMSMDAPFNQNDENSLHDVLVNDELPSPDEELMNESLKAEIKSALNILNDREKEVLKLYFGIETDQPLTLEEIGEKFNLTRERVRQIKEKAIRKLRHNSKSKNLKSYLG